MATPEQIKQLFTKAGGKFTTPPAKITAKLKNIKAFVFDWDGVFNDGSKIQNSSSIFSEVDSMGTNLLRFSNFLTDGKMPFVAIISGEHNSAAFGWTKREYFNACYYKVLNKTEALNHFCKQYNLKPSEIAFVFDDVLDLSIAEKVGVRIFVQRKANPLFNQFVIKNKLADYITGSESGNFAVREACELMMGLKGQYNRVVEERVKFSSVYEQYILKRREVTTQYYTRVDGVIVEQNHNS